jgi:hypothetical protein
MSRESNTESHKGKTKRDKANGSHARCQQNRQMRGDWSANHKHESGLKDFPFTICNGKEGRRWKRWLKML